MKPYITGLLNQLDKIEQKIQKARAKCKHIGTEKIPRANTGNYDPSNDSYWYECHCHDCGKRWRESQ